MLHVRLGRGWNFEILEQKMRSMQEVELQDPISQGHLYKGTLQGLARYATPRQLYRWSTPERVRVSWVDDDYETEAHEFTLNGTFYLRRGSMTERRILLAQLEAGQHLFEVGQHVFDKNHVVPEAENSEDAAPVGAGGSGRAILF